MEIEKDSPKHVILHGMVRWFAKYQNEIDDDKFAEIVRPPKLAEEQYPVGFYGKEGVSSLFFQLHKNGYVSKAKFHGKTMGFVLTEKGLDALEELGTPKQYK